ncbi:MAG: MBL fold metallo-hydrolase [Armatimonadota bacterium]|nr:MBL fold metallo-hydrolase [Armatimonadota bacterium]MDW8155069.1 MBL fold metallo-hydrolase [Armatimonadota bacterium]
MTRTRTVDNRTVLVDLHFGQPEVLGSYLLLGDRPGLVETGPTTCLESLEAGLAEHGVRLEDLEAVAVTHIHLDHAGAAGVLCRRNPRLRVFVHPVGAPHLVDPTRLLRSAQRIYGPLMDTLWGEVAPVPADRVTVVEDGQTFQLGGRALRAVETPGHATHHHVYVDEEAQVAFTGDAAGISLPGCPVVRPPTPPPDLDLEAWEQTLDRLEALRLRRLRLTHFGERDDPATVLGELRRRLREVEALLLEGWRAGEDTDRLTERLRGYLQPEVEARCGQAAADRQELAANYRMNVLGYVRYFEKRLGTRP